MPLKEGFSALAYFVAKFLQLVLIADGTIGRRAAGSTNHGEKILWDGNDYCVLMKFDLAEIYMFWAARLVAVKQRFPSHP